MTQEEFEKLVNEGIGAIPKRFLRKLDNVDIVIEEEPTLSQLKKIKAQKKSIVFGLYEGVPKTQRWNYGQVLPDKITIFKKPIERIVQSRQRRGSPEVAKKEIKEIIKNTIWHEIAHHFGINEKRVRELELKRKLKKSSF
jgi:predicted Zn-dependent protease with MMP-like domain